MKTYLQELRGHVRGNARLRRRLNARDEEIRRLRSYIGHLVTLLDKLGHGDDAPVRWAAAAIGWQRFDEATRAQIQEDIEKVFGGRA